MTAGTTGAPASLGAASSRGALAPFWAQMMLAAGVATASGEMVLARGGEATDLALAVGFWSLGLAIVAELAEPRIVAGRAAPVALALAATLLAESVLIGAASDVRWMGGVAALALPLVPLPAVAIRALRRVRASAASVPGDGEGGSAGPVRYPTMAETWRRFRRPLQRTVWRAWKAFVVIEALAAAGACVLFVTDAALPASAMRPHLAVIFPAVALSAGLVAAVREAGTARE